MPVSSIQRIGDREYQAENSIGQNFKLHVPQKGVSPETRYELVKRAVSVLGKSKCFKDNSEYNPVIFKHGGERWKIYRTNSFKWYQRIIRLVFPFLWHVPSPQSNVEFEIRACCILKGGKKEGGVKATCPLMPHGSFQSSGYKDPFTQLSAIAFQRFERFYVSRDREVPHAHRYVIIKKGKNLLLIKADSRKATPERRKAAVNDFIKHIGSMHGTNKVDYINYLYGLKLGACTELTPEMIYRFNIGTTNIEIQDVRETFHSLARLHEQCTEENGMTSFANFALQKVPAALVWGIEKHLKKQGMKEEVTVNDFCLWLKQKGLLGQEDLLQTPEVFREVLAVIYPDSEDVDRAYTGRKIAQVIQSAYTTADKTQVKPWVDQQEFTQASRELSGCNSFNSFMEMLVLVIVKKHLCRMHPTEKYRVGALIPVPPEKPGGEVRWYKVARCVTNQYIYRYTLESAFDDPSLPVIILNRSTASSRYALYSSESVANNIGHINSPGLMGLKNLEKYERPYFNARSIPLWVGYQVAADEMLKNEDLSAEEGQDVFDALSQANDELLNDEIRKHRTKTLREIIKENDAIFNQLYFRYGLGIGTEPKHHARGFLSQYKKLITKYIQVRDEKANAYSGSVRKDALGLYHILSGILKKEGNFPSGEIRLQELIRDLCNDLKIHILRNGINKRGALLLTRFHNKEFAPLGYLKGEALQLLKQGLHAEAHEKLNTWKDALHSIAISRNENIESKIHQDVIFGGHSLGGACAVGAHTNYLSNENRIPCKGKQWAVMDFDAPATNIENNERFKKMGNAHYPLFQKLKIRFGSIFRRQEVGDFLPLGGEVHLGATYSEKEAKKVERWLDFDAAINERLPSSVFRPVAESKHPHETRFLDGEKKRSFIFIERARLRKCGFEKEKVSDFKQISYSTLVQGILDARGRVPTMSKQDGQKIYNELYLKLWKLPYHFDFLFREEMRKSLHTIFALARKILFSWLSESKQKLSKDILDSRGCFVISETEGIITKKHSVI